MSGVEKAFDEFMKVFEDKASRHQVRSSFEERVVTEKNKTLQPVRLLLKKLMDLGLVVHHSDRFMRHRSSETPTPQLFEVYENQSSPSWYPGISLFFDHPAQVEIAIPNHDEHDKGVVIIRSTSEHPEAHLLHQRFQTVDDACLALSTFLAHNTVRLERAPVKPAQDR